MADTAGYVCVQATVAGLINVVVNPAIDWLSSRHKGSQPIWNIDGLVVNFVITSLILSSLVGAFAAWGAHREIRAGRLDDGPAGLRRLAHRGWLAGLTLGAVAAVLVSAGFWLLHTAGVTRVQTVHPGGATEEVAYDAAGRATSETDARGHVTTHTWDAAGQRTSTTDALGHRGRGPTTAAAGLCRRPTRTAT